jgi:SanA protein
MTSDRQGINDVKQQGARPIRRLRKHIIFSLSSLLGLLVLGAGIGLLANRTIASATRGVILTSATDAPERPVAIIFGARAWPSGPSAILQDRLAVGIELYHAGKVGKLLMSGDHGQTGYDEVNTMLAYALKQGVPAEDIFLDHAGFRTYDTLYRARDVFGVQSAILITNAFHLPRALYTGQQFGLEVVGVASDRRTYRSWLRNQSREFLARTLAWLQIHVTRPRPRFLGPRIDLTGDGRITHDRANALP